MGQPLAVLIVEDNADDVDLLLRVLRQGGYTVDHRAVADLAGLRDALADPRWDIVVSDWSLPGFTGLDAFRSMRERGLDLPFIIISGTISEDIAIEALRAGVHDFMSKDRLVRLLPAVARELADSRGRRQRRLAEAELQHRRRQTEDSERLLRLVIESVPDAVAVVDRRGEFLLWNQPAEPIVRTLCGDPGDPAGGGRPGFFAVDRSTPFDDLDALLQRVAAGESFDRIELFLRHPAFADGRYYSVGARPLRDAGGAALGAVAVFHDSSRERAAQEQLMISDRMASLGMLAAGVAHEINTPLAAVLASLELAAGALEAAGEGAPATLAPLLADARHAADRVRHIVRDLRVFSRHDEPGNEPVDVNQVLESSIRMACHQIRERARLETDYADQALAAGNESRLGQVFLNLLVNAAQAIEPGRPDDNLIAVRTRRSGSDWIVVEVSDSGSGMTAAVREQLFKPFFTTKQAGFGTGLGLAICARIVNESGGHIEVDSSPGQGSTFRVRLPQAAATTPPASTSDRGAGAPTAGDPPARVLVIDDEPLIGAAVTAMLGGLHEVVAVERAEDALSLLDAGERFDVVFCDLVMPGMGGRELYAALQARHPQQAAAVLFLTGGAVNEDSRKFLQTVPGRVVDKPFEAAALLAAVGRVLERGERGAGGGGA